NIPNVIEAEDTVQLGILGQRRLTLGLRTRIEDSDYVPIQIVDTDSGPTGIENIDLLG
ncbi:hypothetical protein ACJMK2_037764, partial [Sinanodonta woodiana]